MSSSTWFLAADEDRKERGVYLRKNPKSRANGTKVEIYEIAHNRRDPATKASKAILIWSAGRTDDPKVRDGLLRLCLAIAEEHKLTVRDPADPDFKAKVSNSKDIISLDEIKRKIIEKLSMDADKLSEVMKQLCISIAKALALQVYDPSDLNSEELPEVADNSYRNIELPVDTLRSAAQDLNEVLGLRPKIDPESNWNYDDIIKSLNSVSELVESTDKIRKDTFHTLAALGSLTKKTIDEFNAKYSSSNNVVDPIKDENTTDIGTLPREQLQRAVLDLNEHISFKPKIDTSWPNHALESSCKSIGTTRIKPIHVKRSILEENTWLVLHTLGSLSQDVIEALKEKYPDSVFFI
jgi:hypothetical protein